MNTEDILEELKRSKKENSPRKEYENQLEEMLVQTFTRKAKPKLKVPILGAAFASILIFILVASYIPNPILSGLSESEPKVFIYHTHNKESFLGDKNADAMMAWGDVDNITVVGEYLSDQLEKRGVPVLHDTTNYHDELTKQNMEFSQSYTLSREKVIEALDNHDRIQMIFDIHRDVQPRDITTTKINGKEVARLIFVVGTGHENYQENLDFAIKMHEKLEEDYPNLSRGIISISGRHYNQELNGHALLIDIGGHQNSIEEAKRAADYLAEVISTLVN